jgi:hypothetical protein
VQLCFCTNALIHCATKLLRQEVMREVIATLSVIHLCCLVIGINGLSCGAGRGEGGEVSCGCSVSILERTKTKVLQVNERQKAFRGWLRRVLRIRSGKLTCNCSAVIFKCSSRQMSICLEFEITSHVVFFYETFLIICFIGVKPWILKPRRLRLMPYNRRPQNLFTL